MRAVRKSGSNFRVAEYYGKDVLISYSTPICYADDKGIHRTWSGWSSSSMAHVRKAFGLMSMTKERWFGMPLEARV